MNSERALAIVLAAAKGYAKLIEATGGLASLEPARQERVLTPTTARRLAELNSAIEVTAQVILADRKS